MSSSFQSGLINFRSFLADVNLVRKDIYETFKHKGWGWALMRPFTGLFTAPQFNNHEQAEQWVTQNKRAFRSLWAFAAAAAVTSYLLSLLLPAWLVTGVTVLGAFGMAHITAKALFSGRDGDSTEAMWGWTLTLTAVELLFLQSTLHTLIYWGVPLFVGLVCHHFISGQNPASGAQGGDDLDHIESFVHSRVQQGLAVVNAAASAIKPTVQGNNHPDAHLPSNNR